MVVTQAIIFFVILAVMNVGGGSNQRDKILLRKKRYLVFPEGSSLSIAICMTAQTGITPGEIFTEGVNWGISYELPNDTKPFKELLDKPKELMQRRHRRELYTKIETIMKSMGYDGRNCVLRALCEASRVLKPKGDSLVDEILRIVF
ncbi:DM4 12 domain containing protein, partial [Asbolus verrucosus]